MIPTRTGMVITVGTIATEEVAIATATLTNHDLDIRLDVQSGGSSKRHPDDRVNPVVGELLAVEAALRNLAHELVLEAERQMKAPIVRLKAAPRRQKEPDILFQHILELRKNSISGSTHPTKVPAVMASMAEWITSEEPGPRRNAAAVMLSDLWRELLAARDDTTEADVAKVNEWLELAQSDVRTPGRPMIVMDRSR